MAPRAAVWGGAQPGSPAARDGAVVGGSPRREQQGGLGHAALEQRYLVQEAERRLPDDQGQVLVLQGEDDHAQGWPVR